MDARPIIILADDQNAAINLASSSTSPGLLLPFYINSRNAKAWKGKGMALKALGRTTEAETAFIKAKELEIQGLISVSRS
jgi:hypothetical protein